MHIYLNHDNDNMARAMNTTYAHAHLLYLVNHRSKHAVKFGRLVQDRHIYFGGFKLIWQLEGRPPNRQN